MSRIRKLCLFDNNPFAESELTTFNQWICFSENKQQSKATKEDLETATDFIVFDNSHFSRLIPRIFIENIWK